MPDVLWVKMFMFMVNFCSWNSYLIIGNTMFLSDLHNSLNNPMYMTYLIYSSPCAAHPVRTYEWVQDGSSHLLSPCWFQVLCPVIRTCLGLWLFLGSPSPLAAADLVIKLSFSVSCQACHITVYCGLCRFILFDSLWLLPNKHNSGQAQDHLFMQCHVMTYCILDMWLVPGYVIGP